MVVEGIVKFYFSTVEKDTSKPWLGEFAIYCNWLTSSMVFSNLVKIFKGEYILTECTIVYILSGGKVANQFISSRRH